MPPVVHYGATHEDQPVVIAKLVTGTDSEIAAPTHLASGHEDGWWPAGQDRVARGASRACPVKTRRGAQA